MPLAIPHRFARLLRLIVAALLTAFVLWKASPSAVVRAGAQADLSWVAVAVALVVADRSLMAYRWLVLLRPIDAAGRPPLGALLRIFFVSTFLGTFLPASVGGDAVRAYSLAKLRVPTGPAVASVLMDRLLGVLSIVVVGALGLMLARSRVIVPSGAVDASMFLATSACLVGALLVFSERVARWATAVALRLPFTVVRRTAVELTGATRAYAGFHGELANVLGGSIGVQLLRIVQAYCLGRALAIDASVVIYFAFIPLILLVMLLPVSINGIGTSQVAFVWFFGRAGVPQAEAFALSVLFVALGIVGNLPGGVLYAFAPDPKKFVNAAHSD
jgi:uncharacterized protein (TIRG00374 family)